MEKQTEERLTNVGRLEEGEGEMYGESNMETHITMCEIDSPQEFTVWLRKLKQGALHQPRGVGWGGR